MASTGPYVTFPSPSTSSGSSTAVAVPDQEPARRQGGISRLFQRKRSRSSPASPPSQSSSSSSTAPTPVSPKRWFARTAPFASQKSQGGSGDQESRWLRRRTSGSRGRGQEAEASEMFFCHVCLDVPAEPVLTLCGHLFCWSCLHHWFSSALCRGEPRCPVCKAPSGAIKVVPIFSPGRPITDSELDNNNAPPRPKALLAAENPSLRRTTSLVPPRLDSLHSGIFPFGLGVEASRMMAAAHGGDHDDLEEFQEDETRMRTTVSRVFLLLFVVTYTLIIFLPPGSTRGEI